jgi:hypothetical protein
MKDFKDAGDIALYHRFTGMNQSENDWAFSGVERTRATPQNSMR